MANFVNGAAHNSSDHYQTASRMTIPVYTPHPSVFTAREVEVLHLLAEGLTTKEIASRLQIAFKTAACHRYRILQKLGVESTVSAVRWAIREGMIQA